MKDVIVIGDMILDIMVNEFTCEMHKRKGTAMKQPAKLAAGGDAQNAASTMGRLGLDVALIGRIGDDDAGRMCLSMTGRAGVDCSHVVVVPDGVTSTCVSLVQNGEASGLYHRGENDRLTVDDIPVELFADTRFVNLHSLWSLPMLDPVCLFKKAKEAGARTFADTDNIPKNASLDDIDEVLPLIDVFAPSYSEVVQLTGLREPEEMIRVLLQKGVKIPVIKLGGEGCIFAEEGKTVKLPGYSITVVDTTGAGDNFAAGLTYGLCKGYSLKDCCRLGNASGAITAGQLASNGAVTSFMQLQEFMIRQDGCGVGGEEGR